MPTLKGTMSLADGRTVPTFDELIRLPIETHRPSGYAVVDLHTGQIWLADHDDPAKPVGPQRDDILLMLTFLEAAVQQFGHYHRMEFWLARHPDHWDDHPDYPATDWANEVSNGDTRLSYREWLLQQADMRDSENDPRTYEGRCAIMEDRARALASEAFRLRRQAHELLEQALDGAAYSCGKAAEVAIVEFTDAEELLARIFPTGWQTHKGLADWIAEQHKQFDTEEPPQAGRTLVQVFQDEAAAGEPDDYAER